MVLVCHNYLHVELMEGSLSLEETDEAIRALKMNIAPGLDGYTLEFYKKISSKLLPYLQSLFQACLTDHSLPVTWKETKIIVLPKPGKDLTYPKSYRPIALLNLDHKILTNVYATRLNKILEYYSYSDQAGFIKGRQLRDCTRRLGNIRLLAGHG